MRCCSVVLLNKFFCGLQIFSFFIIEVVKFSTAQWVRFPTEKWDLYFKFCFLQILTHCRLINLAFTSRIPSGAANGKKYRNLLRKNCYGTLISNKSSIVTDFDPCNGLCTEPTKKEGNYKMIPMHKHRSFHIHFAHYSATGESIIKFAE